jgi:hypothetical protein
MSGLVSRFEFAQQPGTWLWLALALGAGIRVFLVIATEGTQDVPIWQSHAGWTHQYGLVGYYERSEVFNHPPFISKLLSQVWLWARAADVPFRIPFRAIFALVDAGNAWLLFRLFAASPWRYLVVAAYWLNPLAMILSSYHGNTDTGVAFFSLLAIAAAARGRAVAAGVAIGAGLWIKLPVVLAALALLFAFAGWRKRAAFAAAALLVGASTYLPTALEAPALLFERVIAYPGLTLRTPGGDPVWGIWFVLPKALQPAVAGLVSAHVAYNTLLVLTPIILFAWMRRGRTDAMGLGATICLSHMIFFGFTMKWAYQYLAWSIPLWFCVGPRFAAAATLLLGGFVYAVDAYLCNSALLLGPWQWSRVPFWPLPIALLRDAALLFCAAAAVVGFGAAVREALAAARGRAQA